MWFYFILGIVLIAMGLMVHIFKWYFLIAGYNTMPKEKKVNVDTEGLGRLMGIFMYLNGGIFIFMGLLEALGFKPSFLPAIIFFIVSTIFLLIRAQKFDGNIYDNEGKVRKGAWKGFVIPSGIGLVALIFVGVLLFFSSRPTVVNVLEEGINIEGMYGGVYSWDSIRGVELKGELPTIVLRTNGSALGSSLKGYFRTKELGEVKLFVDSDISSFVYLDTDDGVVIFNLKSVKETRKVFEEILDYR